MVVVPGTARMLRRMGNHVTQRGNHLVSWFPPEFVARVSGLTVVAAAMADGRPGLAGLVRVTGFALKPVRAAMREATW